MKKIHLSMINLWCNKNLVDSQLFLWKLLSENGDKIGYFSDPYEKNVEIVILNTCSFISSGREEMFQTIDKLLSAKKRICLIGCGVQYFEKVVKKNVESVISNECEKSIGVIHSGFSRLSPSSAGQASFGSGWQNIQDSSTSFQNDNVSSFWMKRNGMKNLRWNTQDFHPGWQKKIPPTPLIKGGNPKDEGIISLTEGGLSQPEWQLKQELQRREKMLENENISYLSWNDLTLANLESLTKRSQTFDDFCRYDAPRLLTNYENRYEYLKIAEWCNNSCAFCIIPQIRWNLISLPIKSVISDAENLLKQWIEELIIVAQDTMRYGTDFFSKSQLLPLLHELDKLPYNFKYRILYLYPDILTLKQLEDFASLKKFIPYFDIPLQHISPKLLKSMGRFYDDKMIHTLLKWIRSLFKNSFIRTNIIIWFPWETEDDMQLLQSFLDEDYFDNIALFEYHDEPLAKSSTFSNKVSDDIIHSRFKIIRWQVDKLLKAREKKRKWKSQIGYVESVREKRGQIFLSVRPEINCPEIDPVDEVKLENVTECFDGEEIEIGSKVEYVM